MGQRAAVLRPDLPLQVAYFPTALGWFGLWGRNEAAVRLTIGHASAEDVRSSGPEGAEESDWCPALRRDLERYALGESVGFSGYQIEAWARTPFQQRVLALTRELAYGACLTYGELAARAGRPGAARAVGTVMSTNRLPIVIPCHRVLASGGRLGGYTSPSGVALKQRMLAMEGVDVATAVRRRQPAGC